MIQYLSNVTYYIGEYFRFYKNNKLKDAHYKRIKQFLMKNNLDSLSDVIYDVRKIGVDDASDMITYVLISRLSHSFVTKDDGDKLHSILKQIFTFINFLLMTDIVKPNDGIDQENIAGIRYNDAHTKHRSHLTKHILLYYYIKQTPVDIVKADLDNILERERDKKSILGVKNNRDFHNLPAKDIVTMFTRYLVSTDIIHEELYSFFCGVKTPAFMPKNMGLATELFAYMGLTRENIGYVVPLLLHQKLFQSFYSLNQKEFYGQSWIAPTDFLLVAKGRFYALELGRGKPELMSDFASVTGIPTGFIDVHLRTNNKLGYKCPICYNAFTICEEYQRQFLMFDQPVSMPEFCSDCSMKNSCSDKILECSKFKDGKKSQSIRFHCHSSCYNDLSVIERGKLKVISSETPSYPVIEGLDKIKRGL